jgi:hypothetical protein
MMSFVPPASSGQSRKTWLLRTVDGSGSLTNGRAEYVSEAGMLVHMASGFRTGQCLHVEMWTGPTDLIQAVIRITAVRGGIRGQSVYAAAFVSMPDEDRRLLRRIRGSLARR